MTVPPTKGAGKVTECLDESKSNVNHILWPLVTRSQPSLTAMGDFGPICQTALSPTIIKTPNERISLEE